EEAAEETEETAEETTETNGLEDAQKILDQMIADPTADMDEIAKSVNDTYSGLTGHYTKSADVEDSENGYPEEVLSVLRELKDGEVYDQLVQVEDTVYVLRKDLDVDEDETETKRQSLDDAARSDAYTNLLQEWEDNATITVDDKVLGTLEITDSHTFTYAVTEEEEEAEEAVGDPEDAVDVTEEAAEETTEDAAEDAVEEITVEDSEEEATEDTAEETTEETET
ncbi:MAG: hypothetical protein Q4B26_16395, partial [Eubacteriales bacterium]|nr:hypothetical protein [Eubacteriales bacterium]